MLLWCCYVQHPEDDPLNRKLTASVLSALRPAARPYYVSDEQQIGLRVRVATTGALTWNVAFRLKGGGTKSASLGPCDPHGRKGLSLAEARERAAAIVKAARQGRDLLGEEHDERVARNQRLTVRKLIEGYTKSVKSPTRKGGALRTADSIERRLNRALKDKLDSAAEDVTRGNISALLDGIAEKYPREAEKRRQAIGAMYRWGIAKGHVSADPTAGSEGYGRGDPRDRVLAPDEIRAVWDWLDAGAAKMPPDCIAVLRLQLCTGARIGEVAGMLASELHCEDEKLTWTLPAARSKNKSERVTPLVGQARAIVLDALARHRTGSLFKTALSDRALTATDVGHALKKRTLTAARSPEPMPGMFCVRGSRS